MAGLVAPNLVSVTIEPVGPHTHTVVFLHGRGDTARNFKASLAFSPCSNNLSLPEQFPSFRWVFPTAALRPAKALKLTPVSQWFDIANVRNFKEDEELQLIGLRESVTGVRRVLEAEAAALGGRWERVVLAGISMGGSTSVHTLASLDLRSTGGGEGASGRRLGAFLGFSCRTPFAGRLLIEMRALLGLDGVPEDDEVFRNTPMLVEHCSDDTTVALHHGLDTRDALRSFGADVEFKEYPTGGHWFNSPQGMDDAAEFIRRRVLGEAAAADR